MSYQTTNLVQQFTIPVNTTRIIIGCHEGGTPSLAQSPRGEAPPPYAQFNFDKGLILFYEVSVHLLSVKRPPRDYWYTRFNAPSYARPQ